MNVKKFITALSAVVTAIFVLPAAAQPQRMVEVSLTDIKETLAKNLQAEISRIPLMIQVSPEIAAKVCRVGADKLKPETNNAIPSCPAESTSPDLEQAVQRQLAHGEQK